VILGLSQGGKNELQDEQLEIFLYLCFQNHNLGSMKGDILFPRDKFGRMNGPLDQNGTHTLNKLMIFWS
jgi:hypothetical protein